MPGGFAAFFGHEASGGMDHARTDPEIREIRGRYLTAREVEAWPAGGDGPPGSDLYAPLRQNLARNGVWTARQLAGRNLPMGCVALEVTQRCNLDCTACYLAGDAESHADLSLTEILRRVHMIHRHYGPDTNVQITGGDPTLRPGDDLAAIVAGISALGMRPALMTNGIRAKPDLLARLAGAGLVDVAFHVDLTQERRGYETEADLNALRLDYMARASGLGLRIIFNTTLFGRNFHELPALVRFFRDHADVVDMASFQIQADAGRGRLSGRDSRITLETVAHCISGGAGAELDFDAVWVGHPRCSRYTTCLEAGGRLYPLLDDPGFLADLFACTAGHAFGRQAWWRDTLSAARVAFAEPAIVPRAARYVARKLWEMRAGLVRSRGRAHKITFFIHDFMDSARIERERCESCVFMVATPGGPMSMCVHNARQVRPVAVPAPTPVFEAAE